jgi:hypothetical protein
VVDPGLLQQRLGLLGVVGVHAGQVDIAGVGGREVAADRLAQAVEHTVDEGLAVDRVRDRAAHAHVVEGLALVVDRQLALARGVADFDREARIALELLQALVGGEARHAVDVTGEQRRHLRRRSR